MISPNTKLPANSWNLFEPKLPANGMPVWAGISEVTLEFTWSDVIVGEDYSYNATATYPPTTVNTRRELGPEDDGINDGEFDILADDYGPSHALGAVVRARFAPLGVIGSWTLTDGAETLTGDIDDFGGYSFSLFRCPEDHPDFADLGEREARKCTGSGSGGAPTGLFFPPVDGWADLITGGSVTFNYEEISEVVGGTRTLTMEITITLA